MFSALLCDEITKANGPVALVFGELSNSSLSDQGVAAGNPGQ